MTEKNQTSSNKSTCSVCGVTSDERVLICGEKDTKVTWICVHCLPAIIHSAQ